MLNTDASVSTTKINGEKMTVSQTALSEYGYAMVFGTSENATYSQAVTIGVTLVVIVFILFFLAYWVGQLIAKQIAAPIVATTNRLVKVVEGDLHGETPVTNRGDETQILNEAMVSTIKDFSAYIKDIERFLSEIGT